MSAAGLTELVARFAELREAGQPEAAEYAAMVAKLDNGLWKRAEAAVAAALERGGEELAFEPAERLLLDMGLLDLKLVANCGPDLTERLAAELKQDGGENLLYLSEWLTQRYRSFLATRVLPDARISESLLLKAAASEDPELARARTQRNELYRRLAGLFADLPGVKPDLAQAVVAGSVDDRIEELLIAEGLEQAAGDAPPGRKSEDGPAGRQARRYDATIQKVLRLVREHTREDEDLRLLQVLSDLRLAIFRKSLVRARRGQGRGGPPAAEVPAESRPAPEVTLAEARGFLRRELRLMRSLLRIGSQEGKVSHSSVLLHDLARTTKKTAAELLELVREVDPGIGLSHPLLIAPFTGSGFFEWDRDTLVAALIPARSVEDAVVNAVANFRLLTDSRHGGKLAEAYRRMHGTAFRERFLEDYRAWVLRAGRGRREAMPEKAFNFFAEHVGPPAYGPIVPNELVRLSVAEREERVRRLSAVVRAGAPNFEELYHLAVLLWQAERIEEAIRTMEKAAAAEPGNGRALYSLGLLLRRRHLTGPAREAFHNCVRMAPNTLWGVYSHEALRRLL